MKLFVVIVTFNTGHQWLDNCLGSLRNCGLNLHTIVIDNASLDDTPEYIRTTYPEVELIVSAENLGFAKANNLGILKALSAGAEHVFLLNHDAWLTAGTLQELVRLQQHNPKFGILSPIHLNGEGDLLDWNFTNYIASCKDEGRKLYSHLLKREQLQSIYQVDFVNAAAWLLSRACIERVGLFDTDLFVHYGEDTHYAQRVKYHQFEIGVVPNCFVHHDREDRSGKPVQTGFNQSHEILKFVLDTSNVLKESYIDILNQSIRHSLKQMLLSLVKLDFKQFKQQYSVYQKKRELTPVIAKRRAANTENIVQ